MNPIGIVGKQTLTERAIDYALATFKRVDSDPVPLREDASTAHGFTYSGGGKIVVRVNPARQAILDQRRRDLRVARDEKVNGAGKIRDNALLVAKAIYDKAVAEIEQTHRNAAGNATLDFERAEQALLAEFSLPPQSVPASPTTTEPVQ